MSASESAFLLSGELRIQLTIILPLVATLAIRFADKRPNVREAISLTTSAALVLLTYSLYRDFTRGFELALTWVEVLPGMALSFTTEPLGLLFALMASFLWLVTSCYSIGYMRQQHQQGQTRFYQFFAVAIATVMGIAFAANLFTLFVFYELLTLSTYPLVTHGGDDKAKKGGRTYLALLLSTSIIFFMIAIMATWLLAGTLDFTPGGIFNHQVSTGICGVLLIFYIFGIGKAAIFPFHRWLPAAMVAPTPVSALLHAVAVVKGGVFTVLKVCSYIFGPELMTKLASTQALLYLAAASVFLASLVAMRQDNLKKRLAYSTVSQLGYVTTAALLANNAGILAGTMHMVIHAFGKITLFFCAGAILVRTGKKHISQMVGLGHEMPFTMAAFFIASLSIIGLPPTAGLWSKWFLLQGVLDAGEWLLLLVLGLSSLMSIVYLLAIPVRAFFPGDGAGPVMPVRQEAPLPILIAIGVSVSACLLLFIFPQPLFELAAAVITTGKGG
ncbi:monovalent cation/H+ antiporter subunit D family protein [Thalassomonas viridans]|uniref:Monovalent cation/H+ antiporter subunit D family protein n=1 Tax=Thalassomonas viridans TaxID=137584 RepID=A0AAE9ZB43_9GAMM|nr:proton-conducting transporter membrane subunit [Thalassomonas viridans]WDE09035.1 monovalent cation/H+ antiporter subunit D family protein [Thalassomonas viridans]